MQLYRYILSIFTQMKTNKEKTQPEKELDKLKSKFKDGEVSEVIRKKQAYVNRDIKK